MNTDPDSLYSTRCLIDKADIRGTYSNRGTVVTTVTKENGNFKNQTKICVGLHAKSSFFLVQF